MVKERIIMSNDYSEMSALNNSASSEDQEMVVGLAAPIFASIEISNEGLCSV